MCLLVPAELALDRGAAARRRARAAPTTSSGTSANAFSSACVAVGEAARRRQRLGARQQKLDALLGRRVLRQQAERVAEPARGALRAQPDRGLARLAQDRDGVRVPFRAERSTWCARAAAGRRAPRARRRSARARRVASRRCRLVDRAANEWMAEAEAPRHVGGSNEAELQQLVERAITSASRSPPRPRRAPARTDRPRPRLLQHEAAALTAAASSSLSVATTAAGTRSPLGDVGSAAAAGRRGRATGRAARGRRDCRRSPRRASSTSRRRPAPPSSSRASSKP